LLTTRNYIMSIPTDNLFLQKRIWTQDDFEEMGWHDANIYGLTFEKKEGDSSADLLFDIDYIFKWNQPIPPSPSFTFWVAPCTLIFQQAFGLKIDLDTNVYELEGLEIADINLLKVDENDNEAKTYHWDIELQTGNIRFQSQGFKQIVRQKPFHTTGQSLSLDERGGVSFNTIPW
jgi:hypothetical protein